SHEATAPDKRTNSHFQPALETIQWPSGENATAATCSEERIQSLSGSPVAASHIRTLRVAVLVTRRRPSGLKRAQFTTPSCGKGPVTGRRVLTSQMRAD